jgi:hypothetical protein
VLARVALCAAFAAVAGQAPPPTAAPPAAAPPAAAPPAAAPPPALRDADVTAALAAALPADASTDVLLIDQPSVPHAPRARAATAVAAPPATVKAVLLDTAHYRAIIPGLVRNETTPAAAGATALAWELEIPLFNLSGHLLMRERPDGVEMDLTEGDLSPGHIVFTVLPRPGGSALAVDAQLDVAHSTWLLRYIMAKSPVGQPAALVASIYVALRAVALRAERVGQPRAWRPGAPMAPPPAWLPDARPLASPTLAPLRARGAVGLIARTPSQRLGGVAVAMTIPASIATVATRLHDPQSLRAFPGWREVRTRPGPHGPGAEVEDNLPLADFDATWTAEAGPLARWTATAGATSGARLGWEVFPGASSNDTLAALVLYPRLETTGRLGRRSIASEPLLEGGMSAALAFADLVGIEALFAPASAPARRAP